MIVDLIKVTDNDWSIINVNEPKTYNVDDFSAFSVEEADCVRETLKTWNEKYNGNVREKFSKRMNLLRDEAKKLNVGSSKIEIECHCAVYQIKDHKHWYQIVDTQRIVTMEVLRKEGVEEITGNYICRYCNCDSRFAII